MLINYRQEWLEHGRGEFHTGVSEVHQTEHLALTEDAPDEEEIMKRKRKLLRTNLIYLFTTRGQMEALTSKMILGFGRGDYWAD